MTETILAVDDEEDILELVRYNLEREGFQVTCVTSGEAAMKQIGEGPFDLILLDLMLPGVDGLTVARELKADSETRDIPIIMITARGEEADVVTGLEMGADDYIAKPFSPRILAARVRAVLRRQKRDPGGSGDQPLWAHELAIDVGKRAVTAQGESYSLTYTEFQILAFLARRPGWVFTRNQIVDAVRGEGYAVTDRSVDVQIVGLRKKLGRYGAYIETVRGVGYRFAEKKK